LLNPVKAEARYSIRITTYGRTLQRGPRLLPGRSHCGVDLGKRDVMGTAVSGPVPV